MSEYSLLLLAVSIIVLIGYNIYAVRKHAVRDRETRDGE